MARYQDLILSRRDRTATVELMRDALKTMDAIMAEPLVHSQRGYAYTDDDTDMLHTGKGPFKNKFQVSLSACQFWSSLRRGLIV